MTMYRAGATHSFWIGHRHVTWWGGRAQDRNMLLDVLLSEPVAQFFQWGGGQGLSV